MCILSELNTTGIFPAVVCKEWWSTDVSCPLVAAFVTAGLLLLLAELIWWSLYWAERCKQVWHRLKRSRRQEEGFLNIQVPVCRQVFWYSVLTAHLKSLTLTIFNFQFLSIQRWPWLSSEASIFTQLCSCLGNESEMLHRSQMWQKNSSSLLLSCLRLFVDNRLTTDRRVFVTMCITFFPSENTRGEIH